MCPSDTVELQKMFKPAEFAELVGVSVPTLRRWDRLGILRANRNPGGSLYYTMEHYRQYLNQPDKGDAKDTDDNG